MRAALQLSKEEFDRLTLRELTQFSFAKGEETVLGIRHQADAIFNAVNASFSEEPDEVFRELWEELMSRVNYAKPLSQEDYIEHNQRAAEVFINRGPR